MTGREKPSERIARWSRRIEEQPDSAVAHFNLGLAYTDVGKMTSAERAYRRAVELDPTLVEAWVNLAGALLLQWRFEEALEASQRAAELAGDMPLVHFNMGQAYLYLGDADGLIRCNRKVLELEPDHAAANYFLAVGLLAKDDVAGARTYLARAQALGRRPTPEFLRELERKERAAGAVRTIEIGGETRG